MFTVYYSNQLKAQKTLLVEILQRDPNPNPFEAETILVQSLGMAQWLQMEIAESLGIAGNFHFPYPTSFLWQQYRLLFPELPKENIFDRNKMLWHLMRIIPDYLTHPAFLSLKSYLAGSEQLKLYQFAEKVAGLFDQYLVYRPEWLVLWEKGELESHFHQLKQQMRSNALNDEALWQTIQWQSQLWNALVADIRQSSDEMIFNTSHRAYLQQRYFDKLDHLTDAEKAKLPKRIFVFGISSLPRTQLAVLKKLSEHCHIHLFFTNPSEVFWGDNREDKILEKLALKQQLSETELAELFIQQGNPLLSTWGKQGKEFLNLLIELEPQDIPYYQDLSDNKSLLSQVKQHIFTAQHQAKFQFSADDHSIQIHACHSKMREVEVLQNNLLCLFEQYPELTPKDIIVMSADIDSYAPYINAVFSRYDYRDPRFIPFTLSDQKVSQTDPIIASFLSLLTFKETDFNAELLLDLFDIHEIREAYQITPQELLRLREWVKSVGIRSGLEKYHPEWHNYTSWQNGIERLLLGMSLKAENHPWQDILAFNESYGLPAELTGKLATFLDNLTAWFQFIQQERAIDEWKPQLTQLVHTFYQEKRESAGSLLILFEAIEQISQPIYDADFTQAIGIEIIAQLFAQQFSEQRSHLNFLVGKVNFCTLLPMRAIPFKVVCLLGMNEGDFPRHQMVNPFDLMQVAPQKGDRAKREDDRYLFLEALLSAEQIFYLSYIGQSLTNKAEKLPSILVSQLVDYIREGLALPEQFQIKQNAMTVFSPANFTQPNKAYDKEWLAAKWQAVDMLPFLTKITREEAELPNEIALSALVSYIQHPIKYFFNHQLGIYFDDEPEQIEGAEVFELSHLANFHLLDQLLWVKDDEIAQFFENEKHKGNLPVNYFGQLAENELRQNIQSLKQDLSDYLTQESELIEVDFAIELEGKSVRVLGYIPNCFHQRVIHWRVGKLREKDRIQAWIYHLILSATQPTVSSFRFYYREGHEAKFLEFQAISPEQAISQLKCYLNDYFASFCQLKWANCWDIQPKQAGTDISPAEACQMALEKIEDPYLQRILCQSHSLDFTEIQQRTSEWFELMINSIKVGKGENKGENR